MKMQSHQETVLEEFMQRSFGAQSLYVPKKYLKGRAPKEPADLFWVSDKFVALFYLRSSRESLQNQIEHNRRQADGYYRLWATGDQRYKLEGENRFGDECCINFESVEYHLVLLVVSGSCGIHIEPSLKNFASKNIVIVLSEYVFHAIAKFGGTFVDLLEIIEKYLRLKIESHFENEHKFFILQQLIYKYIDFSVSRGDINKRYLSGSPRKDYEFIIGHLSKMKMSQHSGARHIKDKDGRELVSEIFSDLSLEEYCAIASAAEYAIELSEPPKFTKSVVLKISNIDHPVVICTINLSLSNVTEVLDSAHSGEGGEKNIVIIYANVMGINDYRIPLCFALPKISCKKKSTNIIEAIVRSNQNAT